MCRASFRSLTVLLVGIALTACGARSGFNDLALSDAGVVTADALATDAVATDAATTTIPPVETGTECSALSDALIAKIVPKTGACTTVLRLSSTTLDIVGYQVLCAPYGATDEATALGTAAKETGITGTACFPTPSLTGHKPTDDYVFFQPASAAACACCGAGWVLASNARSGQTVLGGRVDIGGTGPGTAPSFPKTWGSPDDLGIGKGCGSRSVPPPTRGWDLTRMASPSTTPPALTDAQIKPVMNAIWSTALPDALGRVAYIFDAVVLSYAASVAPSPNPEWIVLLNSGYLE